MFVCDTADEMTLQGTPPSDPERPVSYRMGSRHFRIPLRYLSPYHWRDVPLETVVQDSLRLDLGWPGLQDRLSATMRACTPFMIGCRERVGVEIASAGHRFSGYTRLPDRRELIPIPGRLHHAKYFAYKNWRNRVEVVFEAETENGETVYGSCRWFAFNEPTLGGWEPTIAGVQAILHARTGHGHCGMIFPVDAGLNASVHFSSGNMADWRAIRAQIIELIRRFERAKEAGGIPGKGRLTFALCSNEPDTDATFVS